MRQHLIIQFPLYFISSGSKSDRSRLGEVATYIQDQWAPDKIL